MQAMATPRKKKTDDFLFDSDVKTSRRRRVAAPSKPAAGPSGPAMSGGPSGPAMSGGPSGPAMSGGPSGPAMSGTPAKGAAPKRRRRAVDEDTLKQLYG
jgi:hypothetical protein